jgi:spore coat protein CotH
VALVGRFSNGQSDTFPARQWLTINSDCPVWRAAIIGGSVKMRIAFVIVPLCFCPVSLSFVACDGSPDLRLPDIRDSYPHYEYDESHTSDHIFNQDTLRRYDLFLEDDDLAFLDADPTLEQYVEGALLFEGKLVPHVGIRYKGSAGSFEGFVEDFQEGDTEGGPKIASKLSMKVKLNWLDKSDKFYDLKKLQFHSQNTDPGMMNERLGWWVLAQAGVAVPRSVHAKVYINGTYSGIYALTEQIDGCFTNYHFEDGDGNVFKEVWPLQPDNTATPEQYFIDALKTNEETADVSRFSKFADELAGASPEELDAVLTHWFDVDKLIQMLAVSILVDVGAIFLGGSCAEESGYGDCRYGNFYWYVESMSDRVHLIPWDLDEGFQYAWNEEWDDEEWDDEEETEENSGFGKDKLQETIDTYKNSQQFTNFTAAFRKSHFNPSVINPELDKWSAQIEDAVAEQAALYTDVPSVEEWKAVIDMLKDGIADYNLKEKRR